MKKMFPEISVGYVTRGTVVKDVTGKRVPVSWQWLERQSAGFSIAYTYDLT